MENIASWRSQCLKEVGQKDVKYSRTVERIIDSPCCVYHALQYSDATILQKYPFSINGVKLPLYEVLTSQSLSTKECDTIWRIITELSSSSFDANDITVPKVPTRTELQQNIRQKKTGSHQSSTEQPSMAKAFQSQMQTLCETLGTEKCVLENASEEEIREYMTRWTQFASTQIEGLRCDAHCTQDNEIVLPTLNEQFPELKITTPVSTNVWMTLKQLNGFSTVGSTIPPKMMGRIEDMANKLANDIVNGKQNMESMNLQEIGKQVLAGCDESDMSNFANRIDELLPALQNLQQRANV